MATPLNYQVSEYDCGPTTLRNALSVLFERKKIKPCMIKAVHNYTLDACKGNGHSGEKGTSAAAIKFIGSWFNDYSRRSGFPIFCKSLSPEDIYLADDSVFVREIKKGAVGVVRCKYDVDHYILVTGIDGEYCLFWDSYYVDKPIRKKTIETVENAPCHHNRRVHFSQMNIVGKNYYSLGKFYKRECLLIYNTELEQSSN